MGSIKITIELCKCNKCSYAWRPRGCDKPAQCPKCHSVRWDKEQRIRA